MPEAAALPLWEPTPAEEACADRAYWADADDYDRSDPDD